MSEFVAETYKSAPCLPFSPLRDVQVSSLPLRPPRLLSGRPGSSILPHSTDHLLQEDDHLPSHGRLSRWLEGSPRLLVTLPPLFFYNPLISAIKIVDCSNGAAFILRESTTAPWPTSRTCVVIPNKSVLERSLCDPGEGFWVTVDAIRSGPASYQ